MGRLSLTYNVRRRAKKMAEGGEAGGQKLDKRGDWKDEGYTLHVDDQHAQYGLGPTISAKDKAGKKVGEVSVKYGKDASGSKTDYIHPSSADVQSEHQRKGLANAMYAEAERHTGKTMLPDPFIISKDAKALWESPNRSFGPKDRLPDDFKSGFGINRPELKPRKMAEGGEMEMKSKRQRAMEAFRSMSGVEIKSHPEDVEELSPEQAETVRKRFKDAKTQQPAEETPDTTAEWGHGYKKKMAEGGDMVSRIMSKRAGCYSEGGQVANDTEEGQEVDELPNQFDDLVLRDELEGSNTGASSGDMQGNDQEDADRMDMVARIIRSRAMKDRLPNPR